MVAFVVVGVLAASRADRLPVLDAVSCD